MQATLNPYRAFNYNTLRQRNSVSFCSLGIPKTIHSDLKQFQIPGKEEFFCGPTSVANSIIDLSQKGYQNLYDSQNPISLIMQLGNVFKTDKNGTTNNNMLNGLELFVKSKGYKVDVKYQGIRDVDSRHRANFYPDIDWIRKEMDKGNAILLNIGLYKKSEKGGQTVYERRYGHFVNVVGKGSNGVSFDPACLTIHDPDNKQGNYYMKFKKIAPGKLIHESEDNEIKLTNEAKGLYQTVPGFSYLRPNEVGILTDVISLGVHH